MHWPPRYLPGLDRATLRHSRYLYPIFGIMFAPCFLASFMAFHHFRHNPEIVVNKRKKHCWEPWEEFREGKAWKLFHFEGRHPSQLNYACPGPQLDIPDYSQPEPKEDE